MWYHDGRRVLPSDANVGGKYLTALPGEYLFPLSCETPDSFIDPLTCREFRFVLEPEEGWVRFELLRSLDWLHTQGAWKEGDKVRFDLKKFGVVG